MLYKIYKGIAACVDGEMDQCGQSFQDTRLGICLKQWSGEFIMEYSVLVSMPC